MTRTIRNEGFIRRFALYTLLCLASSADAGNRSGTVSEQFLKLGTSARAIAMGGAQVAIAEVGKNAFVVLNNDSVGFQDHVRLGPGTTDRINASIAFAADTTFHPVLWDLLESGEIRLVKYYVKQTSGGQPIFLGFERKVIEVVRWGNYYPTTATYPANELHPDNIRLGFIKEGYSVSRYANDNGGKLPYEQNTKASFYLAKDPIPGWFSQESKQ